MKTLSLAAALLAVSTAAAFAQAGTVNAYTPAAAAKAKAAVQAAGYTPGTLASSQNGNFFINATKGADKYVVTVTAEGLVVAGPPLGAAPQVPAAPMSLPPGSKAPERAPGGFGGRGPVSGGD